MERRDFLSQSMLLAAAGALLPLSAEAAVGPPDKKLNPVLLPAQPPLDPNGSMAIRVWMRSAMTNGLFSSVECAVAPKTMGPPPHAHAALDEMMFVLEGTASILLGSEVVEVAAGGWHLRPRQLTHTFWNASDQPLRFVDMYFNQPFEEYLERIFFQLTADRGFPDGSPAKQKEMDALNAKFGLTFAADAFQKRTEIVQRYGLK